MNWTVSGILELKLLDPNHELIKNYGIVSDKLITDAFAEYYIDQLQGLVSGINDFKYHDSGTGTTAESTSNTALVTPSGIARVTGTQVEGSTTKTYKTVATITYDGAYDITEWGLFNASTSGTLMDRAVFAAVTVANNYQIEFTYNHIALSGG